MNFKQIRQQGAKKRAAICKDSYAQEEKYDDVGIIKDGDGYLKVKTETTGNKGITTEIPLNNNPRGMARYKMGDSQSKSSELSIGGK